MGTETTGLSAVITKNVNQALEDKGLKISALVHLAGIPSTTLYRNMKDPESFKVCEVGKIAEALHLKVEDLLKDTK